MQSQALPILKLKMAKKFLRMVLVKALNRVIEKSCCPSLDIKTGDTGFDMLSLQIQLNMLSK